MEEENNNVISLCDFRRKKQQIIYNNSRKLLVGKLGHWMTLKDRIDNISSSLERMKNLKEELRQIKEGDIKNN